MGDSDNNINKPLTFDLPQSLLDKLVQVQKKSKAKSLSEVIRFALQHFDVVGYKPVKVAHKQISVRLPEPLKLKLYRSAKRKKVSLGELLRAALDNLPQKITTTQTKTMAQTKKVAVAKKTVKKTVKKATPKKKVVAKTTTPKKTVKKAAPKKKVVAKKAVKKVAPKKKVVAKKAVKKVAKKKK